MREQFVIVARNMLVLLFTIVLWGQALSLSIGCESAEIPASPGRTGWRACAHKCVAEATMLLAAASTQPTSAADGDRAKQSRSAAWSMAIVTTIGLLFLAALLSLWIMRWGRRLRQPDSLRQACDSGNAEQIDPWAEAGRRLQPSEPDDDRQELP